MVCSAGVSYQEIGPGKRHTQLDPAFHHRKYQRNVPPLACKSDKPAYDPENHMECAQFDCNKWIVTLTIFCVLITGVIRVMTAETKRDKSSPTAD